MTPMWWSILILQFSLMFMMMMTALYFWKQNFKLLMK